MCCDQLVCARCSGPVSEGNCATCRATRAELHHHATLTPAQMTTLVLALLVTMLALVVIHVQF